jgi:hypothetical protein
MGQDDDDRQLGLEQALSETEAAADGALKAAAAATKALKHLRSVVHAGNLRELPGAFSAAEQAVNALQDHVSAVRASWRFDEDAYFADGLYTRELMATAETMGVRLFEADDRLYSYPLLVRVLAGERIVLIDRTRERRLRPTVLVSHLRDLQRRPSRFKPVDFLATLYKAYTTLEAALGRDRRGRGTVVRLLDVYDLLTLLPGQARDYSRQEFARDVYLLDRSGVTTTPRGYTLSLPSSTGTRVAAGTLRVIGESGEEKTYYGVAFTPPGTG